VERDSAIRPPCRWKKRFSGVLQITRKQRASAKSLDQLTSCSMGFGPLRSQRRASERIGSWREARNHSASGGSLRSFGPYGLEMRAKAGRVPQRVPFIEAGGGSDRRQSGGARFTHGPDAKATALWHLGTSAHHEVDHALRAPLLRARLFQCGTGSAHQVYRPAKT
jgi:hypothetical protein